MAAPSVNSIALSLRLARASAFARRGQWREAERAIAADQNIPNDPVALHALAAIATAQGDYDRALRWWEALRQRDPANVEARRMIDAIEVWITRPSWMRYAPLGAAVAAVAVIAIIFLTALGEPTPPVKTSPNVPIGTNADLNAPAASPVYATPRVQPTPAPTPVPLITFPTHAKSRPR